MGPEYPGSAPRLTGVIMSIHAVHSGFHWNGLRAALHVPQGGMRPVARPGAGAAPHMGWLDRLAAWSERHPPVHHRMGSYTRLR